MAIENNGNRIGIGVGLAIVGSTLVGAGVDNISLVPTPWWAILLLIIGSVALIVGLLYLIPPESWKKIGRNIKYGVPYRIRKVYHTKLTGHSPTINISTPKFAISTSQTAENCYETIISSTFELSMEPGTRPSRVNINSIIVCVEVEKGETELDRHKSIIPLITHEYFPQIELTPGGDVWKREIIITTKSLGNKDSIPYIQKEPAWGIDYISVDLPKIKSIQIRKGIKCPKREFLINIL